MKCARKGRKMCVGLATLTPIAKLAPVTMGAECRALVGKNHESPGVGIVSQCAILDRPNGLCVAARFTVRGLSRVLSH